MSVPLVIGNIRLDAFAGGYHALVDRVGKRIYLKHVLPKGELLIVEYPYDDSNQSSAVSAAPHPQAEPWNIPGWEPWDYLQQKSTDLAFQDRQWSEWYHYARKHCLRFDREQPRWR